MVTVLGRTRSLVRPESGVSSYFVQPNDTVVQLSRGTVRPRCIWFAGQARVPPTPRSVSCAGRRAAVPTANPYSQQPSGPRRHNCVPALSSPNRSSTVASAPRQHPSGVSRPRADSCTSALRRRLPQHRDDRGSLAKRRQAPEALELSQCFNPARGPRSSPALRAAPQRVALAVAFDVGRRR